jgi:hypothetical protein
MKPTQDQMRKIMETAVRALSADNCRQWHFQSGDSLRCQCSQLQVGYDPLGEALAELCRDEEDHAQSLWPLRSSTGPFPHNRMPALRPMLQYGECSPFNEGFGQFPKHLPN